MRHVRFALLVLAALLVALPPLIVFSMNECQLHPEPSLAAACFGNAERGSLIYHGTLAAGFALAVGLHLAHSKWVPLGLIALGLGPWVALWA
jgi:hypothetical protein